MPSKTPKQAKFMRAIAHGWTPSRMSSPPSRAVAQEFVNADRKYSGGFAENRYWTGGLAAMDEITAGGKRGSLDLFKWQEGGDVDYPLNQMMQDMQAREKKRIENTLGSARGGHVNYYQEGGAVRPGHAEDVGKKGPNPHDPIKEPAAYKYWETRFHKEPPPPEVTAEVEPKDVPWYMKIAGYGSRESAEEVDEVVTGAQTGQAYGGRVRYQAGGLAIAAPAGGVPPWISPTGSGPGYMDEPPPGYQFGGIANRFNPPAAPRAAGPAPAMAQAQSAAGTAMTGMGGPTGGVMSGPRGGVMGGQYRGVPPQRAPIQPGGGRGFLGSQRGFQGMAARGEMGPGTTTRYINGMPEGGGPAPTGALAQAIRRSQEWQQQQAGGGPGGGSMGRLPPGFRDPMAGGRGGQYGYEGDPSQPGYDDRSYEDFVAQQRQQADVPGLPGITDEVLRSRYEARNANQGAIYTSGPSRVGEVGINPPGGGSFAPGEMIPGGGNLPPYKQLPGQRRMVPPSPPRGQVGEVGIPGGESPGGPGTVLGGPRVPPNMRGYLQKQRMMNRPPSGPVGGGGNRNRIGMADQQGALSRAMQRGTGRPPMSRRMGFGRAGPTR